MIWSQNKCVMLRAHEYSKQHFLGKGSVKFELRRGTKSKADHDFNKMGPFSDI